MRYSKGSTFFKGKISKTGDKKIEVSIDIIEIQAVRMQLSEIPNSLLFSSQNI